MRISGDDEFSTKDEWGVTRFFVTKDGEEYEGFEDPGWEGVYDEDGFSVACPSCGADNLRYHNGQCCCIQCMSEFSDQDITDYAGPWHHS